MILITGGTGFLGRALVQELLRLGHEVKVLTRQEMKMPGVQTVKGDITDRDDVKSAAYGCDMVFHLAAAVDYFMGERELERVNVFGSRNVMEACVENGVKRIVYASSVAVDIRTRYGRSKRKAEGVVRSYEDRVEVVALRFAPVYGPGSKQMTTLLNAVKAGKAGMIGKDYPIHMVDLRNAVSALIKGMDGRPGVWTIADPSSIRAARMYDIVSDALGVRKRRVPKWVVYFYALVSEAVWAFTGRHGKFNLDYYRVVTEAREYDIMPALKEFGYKPSINTEQGMRDLAEWYLNEGAKAAA